MLFLYTASENSIDVFLAGWYDGFHQEHIGSSCLVVGSRSGTKIPFEKNNDTERVEMGGDLDYNNDISKRRKDPGIGDFTSKLALFGRKGGFWMRKIETKEQGDFLMSPKVDFCFKELMRNSEVRKGFLSAVLGLSPEEIEETVLLPTHLQQENADDKLGILDVQVRMKDGTKVDIEINVAPFMAWPERSLFYLGKMYIGQIEKGDPYEALKKCIHIGILDFTLFGKETSYYSCFHLWEDRRNFMYSDKLEIHICELPKLKKYSHPETELLNWMRFINADKEEEMEKMADKNQYIQTAYDDLKMLSANEQKRLAYEERLKAERDYISFAYDNWERGLKQGIQVKTIGLILKKMAKGLTVEETAELTEEDASFVQRVYECRQNHPDWKEKEIADSLLDGGNDRKAD